jgi:hypothetical protein
MNEIKSNISKSFQFQQNRTGNNPPSTGRRHPFKKVGSKAGTPVTKDIELKVVVMAEPSTKRPASWKVTQALTEAGLGRHTFSSILGHAFSEWHG